MQPEQYSSVCSWSQGAGFAPELGGGSAGEAAGASTVMAAPREGAALFGFEPFPDRGSVCEVAVVLEPLLDSTCEAEGVMSACEVGRAGAAK
mmetsp:Transcript_48788/g.142226  ORF Transcript_48788/g.142226 Transcript_48788/m.142226 type:complete len:92 (-) Transcript_48788:638-913(-)